MTTPQSAAELIHAELGAKYTVSKVRNTSFDVTVDMGTITVSVFAVDRDRPDLKIRFSLSDKSIDRGKTHNLHVYKDVPSSVLGIFQMEVAYFEQAANAQRIRKEEEANRLRAETAKRVKEALNAEGFEGPDRFNNFTKGTIRVFASEDARGSVHVNVGRTSTYCRAESIAAVVKILLMLHDYY